MITTTMHRQQVVTYHSVIQDFGNSNTALLENEMRLDYYLYAEERETPVNYSIAINKTEIDGNENKLLENITTDPIMARSILDTLAEGCVTPCCLMEIIDELLC